MLTKLFLSGGFNTGILGERTHTELIDLGEDNLICEQPAELPSEQKTYSAACLKSKSGNPVLCGGGTMECKEYFWGTKEWILSDFTLQTRRLYPAYAEISNGRYWILGGAVRDL